MAILLNFKHPPMSGQIKHNRNKIILRASSGVNRAGISPRLYSPARPRCIPRSECARWQELALALLK
jgi:hypothetical protein